jgi:uncharacterized membrane-anchored protein
MPPQEERSNGSKWIVLLLISLLWAIAGIAAFIMSIVCFGRTGGTGKHILGLLLAIFFGPLYWIYYFVARDYCKKLYF